MNELNLSAECKNANKEAQLFPSGKTILRKWTRCYCGGWILQVFQREKITYLGESPYTYKEPRWQVVNCFPKRGAK